ncbi:MAG: hypothetical protein VX112_01255 [Pseudomonadota bacterium]|nr:hypothetical protein [Pseudomonadota bacterium]
MIKSSISEKISYCFFTIFACFCRDLLYDPVTTTGRLLVSIWMVISVILITIITSIVTSSIIFLHQNGPDSMRDISELSQKKVGFVSGDYTTRTILDELSVQAEPMQDPNALLQAVAADRLQYVVLPKSQYEFQIKKDRKLRNLTTLTSTNIAYKPWTFAVNKDYARTMLSDKTYIDTIDNIIDTTVHNLGLYTICRRYLSAPSHCVF